MTPLRVIFAGSPEIAVPALKRLAQGGNGWQLCAVLTNPDRPKGRGGEAVPTPVAAAARDSAIPVIITSRIDNDDAALVASLKPSLLVSFAYGAIFPKEFLSLFPCGGINCHPSLLPKYRGASPIQEAILARDTETGITIQTLDEKMDRGGIIIQEKFDLTLRETTASLSAICAEKGAELLVRAIDLAAAGITKPVPQDENAASYCGKITKDAGRIDWRESALVIDAKIRAFTPWPQSWTNLVPDTGGQVLGVGLKKCLAPAVSDTGGQALGIDTAGDRSHAGRDEPARGLLILEAAPLGEARGGADPGTVLGVDKKLGILVQTGDGVLCVTRLQWRTKKPLDFNSFLNGNKAVLTMSL
jgi:methionyl-tRNA formyltransferase